MLETGCGAGRLWPENQPHLPAGWGPTSPCLSAGRLRGAHQQRRACSLPSPFTVRDVQELPFTAGRFGAVIADHTACHVPHRAAADRRICRVPTPGGRLYAAPSGRDPVREWDDPMHLRRPAGSQRLEPGSPLSDRRPRTGYTPEHGAAALARWFSCVTRHRYDAAPLVSSCAGDLR